ncbi:hypothetical protein YC2023_051812 [Brassica napus]
MDSKQFTSYQIHRLLANHGPSNTDRHHSSSIRQSPLFPKLPSLFNLTTETSPLFLVVVGKFPTSDVVLGHVRQSRNSTMMTRVISKGLSLSRL